VAKNQFLCHGLDANVMMPARGAAVVAALAGACGVNSVAAFQPTLLAAWAPNGPFTGPAPAMARLHGLHLGANARRWSLPLLRAGVSDTGGDASRGRGAAESPGEQGQDQQPLQSEPKAFFLQMAAFSEEAASESWDYSDEAAMGSESVDEFDAPVTGADGKEEGGEAGGEGGAAPATLAALTMEAQLLISPVKLRSYSKMLGH
jgi:hypothetical protein